MAYFEVTFFRRLLYLINPNYKCDGRREKRESSSSPIQHTGRMRLKFSEDTKKKTPQHRTLGRKSPTKNSARKQSLRRSAIQLEMTRTTDVRGRRQSMDEEKKDEEEEEE